MNTNLTNEQVKSFLTLPGEKTIIAKRQHGFVLFKSIISTISLALIAVAISSFLLLSFIHLWQLAISINIFILSIAAFILAKIAIDWYYHLYIVTNRKIMEVVCSPLGINKFNSVFLDQVRITEVNAMINGFIEQLVDIGDVRISFDPLSHNEDFIIEKIGNPHQIGRYLGDILETITYPSPWFNGEQSQTKGGE